MNSVRLDYVVQLSVISTANNYSNVPHYRLSLYTSLVAHQAGAYSGFRSMKRLRVFLFPPGWDASPSQGHTQQ